MRTVVTETTDAASRTEALRAEMTAIVGDVVENHPGPDLKAMADDVVTALIDKLHLHASGVFVDDSDETRPAVRFRSITGRVDVVDRE